MEKSLQLLSQGCILPLTHKDEHGRQVILVDIGKRDPKISSFADMVRTFGQIIAMIQDDEITSLAGFVFIIDGSNVSFQHLPSIRDLVFLANSVNCTPILRIKKIILYKFPFILTPVKISLALQSKKMKKRVEFADNEKKLHEILQPAKILPQHLGGEEKLNKLIELAEETWTSKKSCELAEVLRKRHLNCNPCNGWW